MKCDLCGQILPECMPVDPFLTWKGKIVGECCYGKVLASLKIESLTGDPSCLYQFDGLFSDEENKRYHIRQEVVAGRGNMGYARRLSIEAL